MGTMNSHNRNMNILEEFRSDASRVLDRLVDGELGQHERRQLLASLDDEPGAWRQCALAFLEAQNWRLQLSRIASEPLVAHVTASTVNTVPAVNTVPHEVISFPGSRTQVARSGSPRTGYLGAMLAIAASLLLAFGLGTRYRSDARDSGGRGALVANQNDTSAKQPVSVVNDSRPDLASGAAAPLRTLILKPTGGESGEPIELPLIESDAEGAIAASARPSVLSGSLTSQFEKDGFVVDRQQRLWPVDLPDGRRVLVPVEEVDIRTPQIERL
jgi:hypothetical protein